jgi:hypothetical protein
MYVAMMTLAVALAGFPGERFGEDLVLGAHLAFPLDREGTIGGGIDVGYQIQWYTQRSGRFDGDFIVWAEEHPAWNYGPVLHLTRQGGAWHQTLGARFGVAWPLRVGLNGGWFPGPGVMGEVGLGLSTAGHGGLALAGVADLPWVEGRIGGMLTDGGFRSPQLTVGLFSPLRLPANPYPFDADQWRAPE